MSICNSRADGRSIGNKSLFSCSYQGDGMLSSTKCIFSSETKTGDSTGRDGTLLPCHRKYLSVVCHFMMTRQQLIKDINKADLEEIFSCWKWRLTDQKAVIIISIIGDLFLVGEDDTVNWLETGTGELKKVANNIQEFEQLLNDEATIDNWFLPALIEQLIANGKTLKENEVYSFKVPPSLGGDYSVENLEPTDISVHFAITGQIHEQIRDLPEGSKIGNVKFQKQEPVVPGQSSSQAKE